MFSIILPTIWTPDILLIDNLIEMVTSSELVSEVILINNAPHLYSDRYFNNKKVKELRYNNIYVNQSWNVGVYQSQNENVCIMNDDIIFNTNIFEFAKNSLDRDDVKIIGVSKHSYSLESDLDYSLEQVSVRNKGWGCLIFLKKTNYSWIPSDLKIYFGDDYLIKQLRGYVWKIEGLKITSEIATSVVSTNDFRSIIEEDTRNSLKYELPWSNDY